MPTVNLGSAGHVLELVRSGIANTRPALADRTGISRSAVAMRVDLLVDAGLIVEDGPADSTGGSPFCLGQQTSTKSPAEWLWH